MKTHLLYLIFFLNLYALRAQGRVELGVFGAGVLNKKLSSVYTGIELRHRVKNNVVRFGYSLNYNFNDLYTHKKSPPTYIKKSYNAMEFQYKLDFRIFKIGEFDLFLGNGFLVGGIFDYHIYTTKQNTVGGDVYVTEVNSKSHIYYGYNFNLTMGYRIKDAHKLELTSTAGVKVVVCNSCLGIDTPSFINFGLSYFYTLRNKLEPIRTENNLQLINRPVK